MPVHYVEQLLGRTACWAACLQVSTPASGVFRGLLNLSCFMAPRRRP